MLFRASEPLLRFRPRFRWDDDTAAYLITSSTRAICVTRKVETERLVGAEDIALRACQNKSFTDCAIKYTFSNTCIAIAFTRNRLIRFIRTPAWSTLEQRL